MASGTAASRHLGVILPDDGPHDYEWHALAAWLAARGLGHLRVTVAGSPCDGVHAEASLRRTGAPETLVPAAERLARAGCGAVVWACTSGSFIGGLDWARAQAGALAAAAGRPATSTALALLEACRALGAARVDLLSPYPRGVGERLVAFLAAGGLEAVRVRHLDCRHSSQSHGLDLAAAVRGLAAAADEGRPLVVPDTAMNSLELLGELEAAAGRPVVTANQVSLWAGLRLLGERRPLARAGRLFAAAAAAPA